MTDLVDSVIEEHRKILLDRIQKAKDHLDVCVRLGSHEVGGMARLMEAKACYAALFGPVPKETKSSG